ncbi:MAG: SRPBCC family protein [Actinobacteria bacterium]|nr:SRPBCC family protein [Actinomycetota bacterium]
MRVKAEQDLVAAPGDVWALLAEPRHLSDWWPGYRTIRPDRRGLELGARWEVVRSQAGLLRRPGEEGLITITAVEPNRRLAWHDVQQRFTATVAIEGDQSQTRARLTVEAPWWRLLLEGLRLAPQESLARLHALCQTAAGLH